MKIRVRTEITTIEGGKIQTFTWEKISIFEYIRISFLLLFKKEVI